MIQHDTPAVSMQCVVVSPDETLFEGEIASMTVPGLKQTLAIMPDHTPLYAQLQSGSVIIMPAGNQSPINLQIESGIIRVRSNSVTLITGFDVKGEVLGSEKLQ